MANEISRRCPNCKVMYVNKDYCPTCGIIINTNLKRKLEREKKATLKQAERNDPKNKSAVTVFLEKIKDHKNPLVKYVARFFYSLWIIILAIGSFIALIFSYIAA